ncbi:hypothetical protein BFL38_04965 [Brachyspira hampsonii]|uniref:Uncharacterized protein n=1 Tax=Brachyspira hampsonii TaxID=1287055 RepID=A0A1E5ND56_9SPIR|nr:hypothetical protein [Brachyspira hampsonii]OEJ14086.1 hypothetical protein BFL38_04965 [Brachyspira hampsonii]
MIISFKSIKDILDEKAVLMKEVYEKELFKKYFSLIPLLQYQFNRKDVYNFFSYINYDFDISFSITAYQPYNNVFCLYDYFTDDKYEIYFSSVNGVKINNQYINNPEKIMLVIV